MTRRARFAEVVALAAGALVGAGACVDSTQARSDGAAREVDVRSALGARLGRVAALTPVPVRVPARLVGFFSREPSGALTPPGSRVHVHVVVAGAQPFVGHVDAVTIPPRTRILVPGSVD